MYENDGTRIVERFPDAFLAAFPVAIETLPMLHFSPGSKFLQVCTVGCNLACGGCVSEILVGHAESLAASGTALTTSDLLDLAASHVCSGIAFALNDPIASFPTFCRLAEEARKKGLSVGCSTNGYMTESSALHLRERIDFANIGLKGATDASYRACGARDAAPVFRTIRLLREGGVHVETSIVYRRGGEDEVLDAARMLAAISPDIPLQVMRFVPFGDAGLGQEPTIYASEELCDRLRGILPWVYLFNSPGTAHLTTFCPECGKPCIEREFFGPMGSHLTGKVQTTCSCGHALPVRGSITPEVFYEPGMMGGYRVTRGLEMVWAILNCLGVQDQSVLAGIWGEVLRTGMLGKELHDRMNNIDAYLDLVMDFAHRTAREEAGRDLCAYIRERLDFVRERVADAPRPRVYYAMGHPLFALNPGRFEGKLVEAAGGTYVNQAIGREGKPGVSIPREEFLALAPEYLFTSGFLTSTVEDTLRYCAEHGLDVPAVRDGLVYSMHPSWDFGSPRWILGLMTIANALHPDRFNFRIEEEADGFYRRFYGVPYRAAAANRSFAHPGTERR
ncbi:radical SAM protein [Methanoculleus sp.]|uniref:radical SAM protein n=1 Tax=Methanoculleus sp. TaxID=90427 RepID=UPI002605314D|nr:radical SAM protein [Methanoculleus sp.]